MEFFLPNLIQNLIHLMLAGIRDWGSLHPVIIHFPVVLLLIAPFFLLFGLVFSQSAKTCFSVFLILLWLGTGTLFLAVFTGEVASEAITAPAPDIVSTLDSHLQLAEKSRMIFSVFTITGTCYMLVLKKRLNKKINRIVFVLSLFGYAYGLIILINAAHQGGRLVHHHGIHSKLYAQTP